MTALEIVGPAIVVVAAYAGIACGAWRAGAAHGRRKLAKRVAPFAVGDRVRLKCGGPELVVDELRSDGFVAVAWWNLAAIHRDAFAAEALERRA